MLILMGLGMDSEEACNMTRSRVYVTYLKTTLESNCSEKEPAAFALAALGLKQRPTRTD